MIEWDFMRFIGVFLRVFNDHFPKNRPNWITSKHPWSLGSQKKVASPLCRQPKLLERRSRVRKLSMPRGSSGDWSMPTIPAMIYYACYNGGWTSMECRYFPWRGLGF